MGKKKQNKVLEILQGYMVPILFTLLCLAALKYPVNRQAM